MLILIAESKTMLTSVREVTPQQYSLHRPIFEPIADATAGKLRDLSLSQLAARLKLGPKSSADAFKAYYDFPDKTTGLQAIEAYTGVVFRSLDIASLRKDDFDFTSDHLLIISSLYGLLHPADIVKPYRLDFNSKVMDDSETPMRFWRSKITPALIRYISERKHNHILNLLPKDAADCIDWKHIKNHAETITADFKIQNGDRLVTPQAGKLKTMRGQLLRKIISDRITSPSGFDGITTETCQYSPELSAPGRLIFIGA